MPSSTAPKVFLSYAASDREQAQKLLENLRHAGIRTWFDQESLIPGENWQKAILQAVESTRAVLLLFGKGSHRSPWQEREMQAALEREARDPAYRIIPVLLPGVEPEQLPPAIRGHLWIDLRSEIDSSTAINRLVASLANNPTTGDPADFETVGDRLRASGDPRAALPNYEKALAINKAKYGEQHPIIATLQKKIGAVQFDLSELEAARRNFESALDIDQAVFGSQHSAVASDLSNLASVAQATGDLQTARALYERALAMSEAIGSKSETATVINNLGGVLEALGEIANARACYERALAIDSSIVGADHPTVAIRLNNLASILKSMGQLAEARQLFERALAIDTKSLGPNHPSVAVRLNNLGAVLQEMGQFEEARSAYERALAIFRQAYGNDHSQLAASLNNLGNLYRILGNDARAREYYQSAIKALELLFGREHSATKTVINNLNSMQKLGRLKTVVFGYDRVLVFEFKDYIQNTLKLPEPFVLIEQPNAGRTMMEKFEAYAKDIDIAFVLLTPDDFRSESGTDVQRKARHNVIYELGYFIGSLGRASGRVILLHKGSLEIPSDLSGVTYINVSNGFKAADEDIRRQLAFLG